MTARPPRALGPVASYATTICLNGAVVLSGGRAIEVHPLPDTIVRDLAHDLRAALPGVSLAVERPSGIAAQMEFETHLEPFGAELRAPRVEDLLDGATGKLLVRADVADDQLGAEVRRVVGERGRVHDSGAVGLAEVSAADVTKATTLARWAASRGIEASQVWAFGDMPNDVEMLTWAGRGIAVANAHPRVLEIADDVCGHHDADGVAVYLEQLLTDNPAVG